MLLTFMFPANNLVCENTFLLDVIKSQGSCFVVLCLLQLRILSQSERSWWALCVLWAGSWRPPRALFQLEFSLHIGDPGHLTVSRQSSPRICSDLESAGDLMQKGACGRVTVMCWPWGWRQSRAGVPWSSLVFYVFLWCLNSYSPLNCCSETAKCWCAGGCGAPGPVLSVCSHLPVHSMRAAGAGLREPSCGVWAASLQRQEGLANAAYHGTCYSFPSNHFSRNYWYYIVWLWK